MNKFEKLFDSLRREFISEARHAALMAPEAPESSLYLTYEETAALNARYKENLQSGSPAAVKENEKIIELVQGSMTGLIHSCVKNVNEQLFNGRREGIDVILEEIRKWSLPRIEEEFKFWNPDKMYSFYRVCKSVINYTHIMADKGLVDMIQKSSLNVDVDDFQYGSSTKNDIKYDETETGNSAPTFDYFEFMKAAVDIMTTHKNNFDAAYSKIYDVAMETLAKHIVDGVDGPVLKINDLGLSKDIIVSIQRQLEDNDVEFGDGDLPVDDTVLRVLYTALYKPYTEYVRRYKELVSRGTTKPQIRDSVDMEEYLKYLLI